MHITGKFNEERLITDKMERLYLYQNSTQINAQTGFQGYLRGDFDNRGNVFHHDFFPVKTPVDLEFADALQKVMEAMRESVLRSFKDMRSFCYAEGYGGKIPSEIGEQAFAFRIDNGNYAFLFRLTTMQGAYHVYCFCYRKDWLEHHMENARNGIRFIDSSYNEKFRLEDGGRIRITPVSGTIVEQVCRYIDNYHVEIDGNLYHICEYAERLEAAGRTVKPVTGKM